MNHKLLEIEERVKRYWYSDGIVELCIGGMFMLLGAYFAIQEYVDQSSSMGIFMKVSLVLLMIAGAMGVNWLVDRLKTRLTYPRTGFVEYHLNAQDARQRRYVVIGVALIILIAWTILFKYKYIREFDSIVLVIGIIAGVIFITLRGKSSGGKRFYVLGALSSLLGIGLSLGGLSQVYRLTLFFGLLGIAVTVSGSLVLHRYLNENPMPVGDRHEK